MHIDVREKNLYHQIHPVKLATDWITGIFALILLWHHYIVGTLVIMFVPSIIVTIFIINYVDLSNQKASPFGKYISNNMTKSMEMIRFIGFVIAIFGAWFHFVSVIVVGIIVILLAWLQGVWRMEKWK